MILRNLLDPDRRLDDVLQRSHVPEKVESLEDHPNLGPLAADLCVGQLVQLVAVLPVADELAVHPQTAGVDLLEMVDAAEERGLARARGTQHAHHLAGLDFERDPLKDFEATEALVHAFSLHHRTVARHGRHLHVSRQ